MKAESLLWKYVIRLRTRIDALEAAVFAPTDTHNAPERTPHDAREHSVRVPSPGTRGRADTWRNAPVRYRCRCMSPSPRAYDVRTCDKCGGRIEP